MELFHGVDDLRAAAGTHLGHSDWHTITQYQVDAFAAATGDHGANKLRFPSPVPVGSKARAGVELLEVAPIAHGYQVATRVTIERGGVERPACVVDMLSVGVP